MFDVSSVREIEYGASGVTYVYQDHDNPKLWYMVPVPRLRTLDGAPSFGMTEYTSNGGGIAGLCTFEMELVQPLEARRAAEEILGSDISWGGFVWVGGTAYFYYDIAGENQVLAVEPTLYGTNVAAFQIELETAEAVNSFKNAFSGDEGGASTFRVEYEMQVLTKLLGAKATVIYTAEAAIEYEKKYKTVRDTWGNQKQVLQEVKQVLRQSGAGEVKVELGPGSSDELAQRVRDWGWTTLENQVANTVAAAAVMATGPNPVSATTSFNQTYQEDTVIDWSTPVSSFMRRFSSEEWRQVFTRVDNRKLSVVFNLIGELNRSGTDDPVAETVAVTVTYPTRPTDNTFTLIVTDGDKSSKIFEAPGDFSGSRYNPEFSYTYVINFKDGKTFKSDPITTTDTLVNITPNVFGTRQVTFIGQNIPFSGPTGVREVNIDFFFAPPAGNPAIVQTKTLTANGAENGVRFDSFYNLPIGQNYSYRLRYQMADNSEIVSEPPGALSSAPDYTGSGNADIVFVADPKGLFTQFTLRAFNYTTETTTLLLVDVNAQYFDPVNNGDKWIAENTWSNWQPTGLLSFAEPRWNFQAVDNTNNAYFNLSGTIFYSNGESFTLDGYRQSSEYKTMTVTNTVQNYSVKVDSSLVDWTQVASVNLTMFQLKPQVREKFGKDVPAFLSRPRHEMTTAQRIEAEASQQNVMLFSLLGAPSGVVVDSLERFYGIQRPIAEPTIEFYYTAVYVLKDGTTRELESQEVSGRLSVELPALPPATVTPGLVRQVMEPGALAARMRQGG